MKICTKCKKNKILDSFHYLYRAKDHRQSRCKLCRVNPRKKTHKKKVNKVVGCRVCNKIFVVWLAYIKRGGGKFCSRACFFIYNRGKNHKQWKNASSEYERIRGSRENKQWIQNILKRDDYTCQMCWDDKGGNLHAHHIKRFIDFPELRFELNNGITLCENCHMSKITRFETVFEPAFNFILMQRGFLDKNRLQELVCDKIDQIQLKTA